MFTAKQFERARKAKGKRVQFANGDSLICLGPGPGPGKNITDEQLDKMVRFMQREVKKLDKAKLKKGNRATTS